jgi:hypothetical protein
MTVRTFHGSWLLAGLFFCSSLIGCEAADVCVPPEDNPNACWCPGFQGKDCDQPNPDFGSTWMQWVAENQPSWKSLRLRDIALPGTHDSASGYLDEEGANITAYGVEGGESLVESVPEFLSGWAKTQLNGLTEQLRAGVRYFDLRMVLNTGTGPTFHHGDVYWDTEAIPVFEAFRDFMIANPGEIIIFSMINFAGQETNEAGHAAFVDSLQEIFGELMVPAAFDAPARTIDEILETPGRLVVFYERTDAEGFWEQERAANLYSTNRVYSNYDVNVNTGDKLEAHLMREMLLPVDDVKAIQGHLQYSQEVIQSDIALYIEGYTKQERSVERAVEWLAAQRDNPEAIIRIVQFDYFELQAADFMKEFAEMNRAISNRTE